MHGLAPPMTTIFQSDSDMALYNASSGFDRLQTNRNDRRVHIRLESRCPGSLSRSARFIAPQHSPEAVGERGPTTDGLQLVLVVGGWVGLTGLLRPSGEAHVQVRLSGHAGVG